MGEDNQERGYQDRLIMICAERGSVFLTLALTLWSFMPTAFAQAPAKKPEGGYPSKLIRLIVPNPPGGGVDIIARLVGEKLAASLGQSIVVDNRPGAGGTIGVGYLAKSAPDGYTLGMGIIATLAIAPALYQSLPYDPQKDFEPITLVATLPMFLAVHPSLPVKSVKDLIALERANPGKIDYSSGGNGTLPHLAGVLLNTMAKIKISHVPYKGGPAQMTGVVTGEVSVTFGTALTTMPHVRSGRLRAVASTSERRSSTFPNIPSISESGVPGYHAVQWYGVIAPAGTPQRIVDRLNREIRQVARISDVKARLLAEAADLGDTTPEQFRGFIREEIAKWGKVVQDSGTRVD